MSKLPFKIGDWVYVHEIVEFATRDKKRTYHTTVLRSEREPRFRRPVVGQICGARWRCGGSLEEVDDYGDWEYGSLSSGSSWREFRTTHKYIVWEVRLSLVSTPIEAFESGMTMLSAEEARKEIPDHVPSWKWSEEDKQLMRDVMKDRPRDARGRWLKQGS